MQVAISTDGDSVSAHFGRCPHFTIVSIDNGKVINKEVIENPGHQPGFIPQFLKQKGVEYIICGGMGMTASNFFNELGIQTIVGITGQIDEVIDKLQKGTLECGESLCNPGAGKGYGLDKTECTNPNQNECEDLKKENKEDGMKICITSQGDNLDSQIDPRFGRCQYFIFADTGTLEFEAIKNPNLDAMGGAGIQSGQIVIEKEAKAVLTGNVGPNAFQTLEAAGVAVITNVTGSVKEAIEGYNKGGSKPTQKPTVESKFNMPKEEK